MVIGTKYNRIDQNVEPINSSFNVTVPGRYKRRMCERKTQKGGCEGKEVQYVFTIRVEFLRKSKSENF